MNTTDLYFRKITAALWKWIGGAQTGCINIKYEVVQELRGGHGHNS